MDRMLLPVLLLAGCSAAVGPLDLASPDPTPTQSNIAQYYAREAAFFRFQAQEFHQRVLIYEALFGPDSDWVRGARLLAQFYEESALEQDRLVRRHMDLAERDRPVPLRNTGGSPGS